MSTSCSRRRSPPDSRPIGRPLGVGVEPEALEEPGVLPVGRPRSARRRPARPAASGSRSTPALVVDAEPRRCVPDHDLALDRREPAGDHVEQRRLAGAVGADDPEPLAGIERQVDAPEQPRIRRRSGGRRRASSTTVSPSRGAPKARSSVAAAGRRLRAGPRRSPSPRRCGPCGLRVRAGAPRRSQASSERARLRRTVLPPGRLLLALGAGLEVAGVAAVVHVAAAPVELEDAGGHPVEHVAVVGDEHEAAAVRGQALLEPGDGVDVEVVRRLVEDQQRRRRRPRRAGRRRAGRGPAPPAWPRRPTASPSASSRRPPMPSRSSTAAASQPVADDVADRWRRGSGGVLVEHHDPRAPASPHHARPRARRCRPAGAAASTSRSR